MAYDGITTKVMADGSKNIFVRFKYLSKTYPVKNFTKIFGCKTEKQAFERLQEVKVLISQNKDPFTAPKITLNAIFDEMARVKIKTGKWKESTAELNCRFYDKYMRKQIGWKNPSRITKDDLMKIITDDLSHMHDHTKIQLVKILKPIIEEEIEKGNLYQNVLKTLPSMRKRAIKESINVRSLDTMEIIAKKIYKSIPFYRTYKEEEVPNFLYFSLLTAQRVGQIRNLEIAHFDLERKICVAPATITKTGEPYRFPIPDEVIPYLKTITGGKVFPTIHDSTVDYIYRKLVKIAGIHLVDGKNITAHDTRRLVLYIMTMKLGINPFLADSCLNHKQKSAIADHYWNHSDDDVVEAFQRYWEYVRDPLFEFEPIIKERSRRRTKEECERLRAAGMMKPKDPNRSYELEKAKRQNKLNRL